MGAHMSCGVTQFLKEHPIVGNRNVLEDISTNYVGAGVGVKQVLLPAGYQIVQHQHKYAHLSILQYGRITIMTDDFTREMEGPDSIVIAAHKNHMVIAHTDAMWLCVHATEDIENLVA
jgi:quercetin dioxygenase-like cupin family protein